MPACFYPTLLRPLQALLLVCLVSACGRAERPMSSLEVTVRAAPVIAFDRQGDWAVVASNQHGGSLWRLTDGERLYDWNHRAGEYTLITQAAFSPEGDWAATSDGRTLVLWDRHSGGAAQYWSIPSQVLSMALGPNGDRALLALSDNRAVLYDIKQGGILRSFHHAGRVNSVALSADGSRALTGADDGTSVLWDTTTGEALQRRTHPEDVQLVALSDDGRFLLSAAKYDEIVIWTPDGETHWRLPFPNEWLRRGFQLSSARFSPDGTQLLTGRPDGRVQLWDVAGRSHLRDWRLPRRNAWEPIAPSVRAVGFYDGGMLAGSSAGFIHQL